MGTSSTLSAGRSEGLGEGGCAANPSYEPLRDRPAARLAEPDLIPPPWPGAYAPVVILISEANEMRGSQTGSQRRQTSGDARAGIEAVGQRLDTARADHPPAAGNRFAASSPARPAFNGRTTPKTHPPDCDDTNDDLSPQLRRRHVYAAETRVYEALPADDFR